MILPGGTLGVLGGGQLGRMFTAEAQRLGYRVVVLDPDAEAPAGQIAHEHITREWGNREALAELAARADAITTEFENVPADVLRALAAHCPVRPSGDAVWTTQDRLREKAFLNQAGVDTVGWQPIASIEDCAAAWQRVGPLGAILKTAQFGYDGKGQARVAAHDELAAAWRTLGEVPCILEERVALATELSVMVARGAAGAVATWPVGENVHIAGILHTTVAPAVIAPTLAEAARTIAERIVAALDYVGVMGVECFVTSDGRLLVNELAPRPHNSGHWTLDAAVTSQFEQQVRILAGLPLGETTAFGPTAMVNILGDCWADGEPKWAAALAMPGVRLHLYGKREPRAGRKMGHLTVTAETGPDALQRALAAWRALTD
ncbi:MAG: 5-(carboxyamino)imidazole ribonucleotide synthase [Gemmatimonadetes bacterium]|nr:5-(carboxyamino)imidazole ribonucleotide synthase [Gemmatimonadota bacterium]